MNEYKLFTQRIGLIGITNLLVSLSAIILLPILTKTLPIEDMVSGFRLVLPLA